VSASNGTRAVPFFCPFCGEESIRPWGDDPDKGHGDWRCEDCSRVFSVRYRGLAAPVAPTAPAAQA
jgi:transposase-like protein